MAFKVTYATLSAQSDEMHEAFDIALGRVREELGENQPMYINGEKRWAQETFAKYSPINTDWLLGTFQKGTRQDAKDAIAAAKAASPAWARTPWQERVTLLRRAADLISERRYELSALMSLEVGKNRLESLGDVEETADLIRYYCQAMEDNHGFDRPMGTLGPNERTRDVLKPYGVWVVISPFNFPFALAGGPAGGALVAGNTVVFKPASDTPHTGLKLAEAFMDAGLPKGVFNFVTGPGSTVGDELVNSLDVDGITFTGSFEVGFNLYKNFGKKYPRPCIAEMGGKNATIVSRHADLDEAAEGVMRSAFGLQGQKCSAASRVYVEREVKEQFTQLLLEKTRKMVIGDPSQRNVYLGPVINKSSYEDFKRFCEIAKRDGDVINGGEVLTEGEFAKGYFATPTIVDNLPKDHQFFYDELFLPIVALASVDSLDEAMTRANDSLYGLTAGFYSEKKDEIDWFLDKIEAGVVYVNRRAGATTGAWPGIQPFGGWKGSGSTGKNGGGPYYVQQYLHEQSQTVVE
jgi:1-pyrroline-5-carboxylate dehydrogenase